MLKASLAKIIMPAVGETPEAWLPAELVTNLYDETRENRRIIEYKRPARWQIRYDGADA